MIIVSLTISTTFLLSILSIYGNIGISPNPTLIFLGLFYAGFGKNYIYRETYNNVESTMNWFGFVMSVVCVYIIGFIVGFKYQFILCNLYFKDLLKPFIFYPFFYLTRFISLLLFSPLLKKFSNYDFSIKKIIVLR